MKSAGRLLAAPILLTASVLLGSCGGGDPQDPSTAAAASRVKRLASFVPTDPIPSDANVMGMWSPVKDWPLIAIHAILLPDGRLLTYGSNDLGKQTGYFQYDIWDPEGGLDGGHLTLPNYTQTDIFCSAQLVLPTGDMVAITGGDNWDGTGTTNTGNNNSNVFTPSDNALTRSVDMNRARWYASMITLLNGESYIQGGSGGSDLPEVRQVDGTYRLLTGADTSSLASTYPRNFVAPDGRVFGYDGNGRMYYVDPAGTGQITRVGQFDSAYAGNDSSAAMFRPGRILQFGGNSNNAVVIDIRGGTPSVTLSQAMSTQRRLVNATILADGKVLATGGSSVWNELVDVNTAAEIWNPDTGTWTLGAQGTQARLYHSSAILLPDATVLVMGGGAPGPQRNLNVELYFPPYLFADGGVLAPRLSIDAAPSVLSIGATFNVDVSGGTPARMVMVKTGSVTHSFNMEQRFVELTFNASGRHVAVQAPTNASDAPPGMYMLFAIDGNGVPSVARILRVSVADTPNPSVTPTLASPGDQATTVGSSVLLALQASDPNGDVLGYAATGLPPGLGIDPASGVISGQALAVGVFNVVVAVSDGVNSATRSLTWTVSDIDPFVLTVPTPPTSSAIDGVATFIASTNGVDTLFKWNFGDGTPETEWSASPTATHTYARPGLFTVTVSAVDSRGVEVRRTVLQSVHLPLTSLRPAMSTNIVIDQPAVGDPRLWVVNQDNDSVSVFNLASGDKLAEIAVGAAPRSLAIAPSGFVWVTNKRSASISVIDPSSLSVSATLALPRGSQPFGVAMSSNGIALVVLEAGGQLLRFDAASNTQTGSLAIGRDARQVSITADGSTALVTRYVTPPIPGESTQTPLMAQGGAEVLAIAIDSLSPIRTTRLAASDRTDAENQGRGIPNYLGAAAISPDGRTAFVPSKQDNIARGVVRDGQPLNFQNTVRAISSRLDMDSGTEDLPGRIDHDNASLASAALFDSNGVYLFVALETSREVAVIDAYGKRELFRFEVGMAPQGLALSPDGLTLAVNNFMSRTVSLFDLKPLIQQGLFNAPLASTLGTVASEKLAPNVLRGKQLFYDARDTRLARDNYLSCATCHNDGGHDGRVWDLTGFGEGLRNTISLNGRAGMAHGNLHWSNNFDEVQDFEGQIRALSGGTGLLANELFLAGTRSQPLGDKKAGLSADLDALAAYVGSLSAFQPSPMRPDAGTLSAMAVEGRALFGSLNCASCHGGSAFTVSGDPTMLVNIGTIRPSSGQRLGGSLTGIDVPTLRDVWATAPYLHDGSAATLEDAVRAHNGLTLSEASLLKLGAYLREIGADESTAPTPQGFGIGLSGAYFSNRTLTNPPVLVRTEAVDFSWGTRSPGPGVSRDNFSARWTGSVYIPTTGDYRFRTASDAGVRLRIDGKLVINNWTAHTNTTNTTSKLRLQGGRFYHVVVEYFEDTGAALIRLKWLVPGTTTYVAIPSTSLFPQ